MPVSLSLAVRSIAEPSGSVITSPFAIKIFYSEACTHFSLQNMQTKFSGNQINNTLQVTFTFNLSASIWLLLSHSVFMATRISSLVLRTHNSGSFCSVSAIRCSKFSYVKNPLEQVGKS